ncbi:MAG: dephospho-CoA kinase [Lachnospiraceae bacterium]|nr:dephospho-CoA kinase [Lachnospiraceae bacterium]
MKNNLVIGITGGIGAGKSTVMNILKTEYQAFILETDKAGHVVMNPGGLAYQDIITNFGRDVLNDDETVNRKILADIVFNQPDKLALLNSIIHPNVKKYIICQIDEITKNHKSPLIFIESALLLNDNYDKMCDSIWYIYSDIETRFERVNRTRNMSRERFDEIVSNQLSDEILRKRCNVIIDNDKSIENTKEQIDFALKNLAKED